ncbi:MAG TPA: phospholipid carrier-dependent glycosyltransferase, partial [Euryarchaeota archaeon]|nr:phospholipid carrier-dependent glycosyltransferase [Euryarchaeota archaeon]
MKQANTSPLKNRIRLIIFIGLILRVAMALRFNAMNESYFGYDESVYYSLAQNMASNGPFAYTLSGAPLILQSYKVWYLSEPLFHHPPLYTWLLYLWQQLFGSSILVSRIPNILIGLATIYIVYLIGSRLSEETGLIAAFLIAISALNIQQSGLILTDNLLAMLTAAFILFTIQLSEGKSSALILCGLTLGLAVWTKYFGLLVFVFILSYTFFKKISIRQAQAVLAVAAVISVPWFIWNLRVYGLPIPIETWKALAPWYNVNVPFYAYLLFLPLIAPFTLLTYINIGRLRRDPLKTGLALVFITYLAFFSIP